MKPITVLVGGDLAPTISNFSHFIEGNIKALIDDKLLSVIHSADYRIFNLEVPLTDTEKPIKKAGPNLIAPGSTINGIKLIKPSLIGLANNHILDQDEQGLTNTIELLRKNEINIVGAGKNLTDAAKPVIIEKEQIKIGIYACAEHEFSIAEENKLGVNPFDPLESLDHIQNLKSSCDFVIVLYHGGKEHYRFPSPYLQKTCRKIIDKGADAVICQHSHCIGSFENHSKGIIIYGQGNFLFDRRNNEFWNTSLLLKFTFDHGMALDFIPISKKGIGIELPEENLRESILKEFYARSAKIKDSDFIENEYQRFCQENSQYYLATFAGFGRILRKADSILNGLFTKMIFSSRKLSLLENYVECEAHRELILNFLRSTRKKL